MDAANNADLKLRSKISDGYFQCYYCRLDLCKVELTDIRFEHYEPKIQSPQNIVPACKWCDEFKHDRMPEDFAKIVYDDSLVKRDKYAKTADSQQKLIEFAPLVACHHLGTSDQNLIEKMIEIAEKYYNVDLRHIPKGQVRYRYYELYRKRWISKG